MDDPQGLTIRIARLVCRMQAGTGIGHDARRVLHAGADKVSVNTAAVSDPELLAECGRRFGRQCVVLAIDARRVDNGFEVVETASIEVA